MSVQSKSDMDVEALIFERVRDILESARMRVVRTVNTTQVVCNWLIGREIVENQQQGRKRADYGDALLTTLSERLGKAFGRGFSVDNLEAFRQLYIKYPELIFDTSLRKFTPAAESSDISETAYRIFPDDLPALSEASTEQWQPGCLHASLSWSHYRALLRVRRKEARAFYEIETIRNAWAVRELSRQVSSLLFDRLAKSRDKNGLLALANEGLLPARPIDVLKDPMVLEFL